MMADAYGKLTGRPGLLRRPGLLGRPGLLRRLGWWLVAVRGWESRAGLGASRAGRVRLVTGVCRMLVPGDLRLVPQALRGLPWGQVDRSFP